MIKSIKTLPQQISSIEVSDESDIESLSTEYGVGSTVRVTGQISAEYILTPNGWEKIGSGGGSQEPLILTLNPYDIEDVTRGGTYTGATPSEVAEQFMSGRPIFANFLNAMLIQMTAMDQSDGSLIGFVVQVDGGDASVITLDVNTAGDTFSLSLRALT